MESRRNVLKPFEEKRSYMEDRISSGIESARKGFVLLDFIDENKRPVTGVKVKVTQKSHDFKNGANLFLLDELPSAEENERYKALFADVFNIATLPFYWDTLEPEQGRPRFAKESQKIYRRPAPDLCLEFCEKHGIEPKAHCLNYAGHTPRWAKGTVDWEKRCLAKRFRELAERYAGKIPMWEVTNETFARYPQTNFYAQPDFVEWSFKLAENLFPANRLIINDSTPNVWSVDKFRRTRTPYFMQIERAMLKGARIDGIGMQFHMFYHREDELASTAGYYDPEHFMNVLDTYAALGLPLHVTEMTIPAYSAASEDEAVQAEIVRNLYRMLFSHPAVEGIIYWNTADGYAYVRETAGAGDMSAGENYYYGGLLRHDLSVKPAWNVIRDLFAKEWRTDLELHTDTDRLSFRGFFGRYEFEVTANGKTVKQEFHLGKDLPTYLTITI